jgi:5-methylcytosine-specific restriction endonuclease McrA
MGFSYWKRVRRLEQTGSLGGPTSQGAPGVGKSAKFHRCWAAQGGRCAYCQAPMGVTLGRPGAGDATWDHVVPRSRGGTSAATNLVLACWACNSAKGSMTQDEFLARRARKSG